MKRAHPPPRRSRSWIRPAAVAALLCVSPAGGAGGDDLTRGRAALDDWLRHQREIRSWTAEVVQTRSLEALSRPLESPGRVWFQRPNRFRWELGDPPRTIAVRSEDELTVVYPRLRRAEVYRLREEIDPAWRQALTLLEVGFPSEAETFHGRYELVGAGAGEGRWSFQLRPTAEAAVRLIDQVRLEVSDPEHLLLATELVFPDGSSMRNEFSGHRLDPPLEEDLFSPEIGGDYEVARPLEEGG